MNKVDITVIQKPIKVRFVCPKCEEEVYIKYADFIGIVDDPCDWNGTTFECPECGALIEIDDVYWY